MGHLCQYLQLYSGKIAAYYRFLIGVHSEMITLYYQPDDDIERDSKKWSGIFMAIGGAALIFNTIQVWSLSVAGENLIERVRKMTFRVSILFLFADHLKAILRQEVGWFDKEEHASGILTSKLASEATLVEGLVGSRMGLTIQVCKSG
jgi:ATP-binding cassette subfamily B (MDR/TAP) protein 1